MSQVTKICAKRLQGDMKLLKKQPLDHVHAAPDPDNMLIWYFMVKGPKDSHYANGHYIGKIMHSPDYPFKAPDFMMLTPNGRFATEKKICLTNSGYHSESWSAIWNIRSIMLGFISIMMDDSTGGISHIKRSKEERLEMAKASASYNIKYYGKVYGLFEEFIALDPDKQPEKKDDSNNDNDEDIEVKSSKKLSKKERLAMAKEKKNAKESSIDNSSEKKSPKKKKKEENS